MAAPTLFICRNIRDVVRHFFAAGFKSGNKEFDTGSPTVQIARANKRNADADESRRHRLDWGSLGAMTHYDAALLVEKMPRDERSGNCGEMADLSGLYAFQNYSFPRNQVYIGTISHPGDHVFCLLTPAPIGGGAARNFASVTAFVGSAGAGTWGIVDPWLNTSCFANNYLTEGGNKLDKWQADGKRIMWNDSNDWSDTSPHWGWYPPGGFYKTQFAAAPVTLEDF